MFPDVNYDRTFKQRLLPIISIYFNFLYFNCFYSYLYLYLYFACLIFCLAVRYANIENRIYIRGEFTRKKPFCCTVSILQVYFTHWCYITFWALEYLFIENKFLENYLIFFKSIHLTTCHAFPSSFQQKLYIKNKL